MESESSPKAMAVSARDDRKLDANKALATPSPTATQKKPFAFL